MYKLACFGDSLIQGFPFGNQYSWVAVLDKHPQLQVYNYGLCGDCSDDIFDRMKYRCLDADIRHILFLGGANDILQGVPEKFTLDTISKMVKWCADKNYQLCLVLPLISSDAYLNRKLLNLKQELQHQYEDKIFLLDLQPAIGLDAASRAKAYLDGVHPNNRTYQAMGEYALPLIWKWINGEVPLTQ